MIWKKHKLFRTFCWVVVVPLLLMACGDPEPTPTPTQTPLPPTATEAPAAAVEPESPVATPTPAADSPLLPEPTPAPPLTETVSLAEYPPLVPAVPGTVTVASAAERAADGTCIIQPDLDLAGYPDLEAAMGCAVEPARFDDVGINEFGPGPEIDRFMLWLSNEAQIYVLRPDHRWEVYVDSWSEDQPTYSCNPLGVAEDSPPLPRRGFSKIWCSVEGLAEIMGTVPREERLCQHAVIQQFERGRLLGCYEDATIRYIRLLDNNTWDTILTR